MYTKTVLRQKERKLIDTIASHRLLVIFIVCMIVFNVNLRPIPSLDTRPAALLPYTFLNERTVVLDSFADDYVNGPVPYSMKQVNGHYVSIFPMVVPVIVTPIYIIPFFLLKLFGVPFSLNDEIFANIAVPFMEKLAGSLVASLSVVILYLALRKLFSERISLLCSFIYAFATLTWAISSQALWQHGFIELFLAGMLYIILDDHQAYAKKNIAILGVLSGLMVMCRPSDAPLALPAMYYVFKSGKLDAMGLFAIAAAASAAPFLAFNQQYYGHLTGYYSHWEDEYVSALASPGQAWLAAFAGLLISPSRGLFVYSPILIFSFAGIAMYALRRKKAAAMSLPSGMAPMMALAVFLTIFVYMLFPIWFGGWNYGYRYLTGMLPLLIVFLGYFFVRLNTIDHKLRKAIVAAIVLLLAWSVFVEAVGAFYYPAGDWDGSPVPLGSSPERLWDMNDTQISRSFNTGPIWPPFFIRAIQEAFFQ